MTAAIEITDVAKAFGGVRAVDGLSLTIEEGAIYGILGPNGAGKTTVLNLLSGFIRADSGRITIAGTDTTRMPAYRIARLGVARTYQNIRLAPGLTVLQTVMAGAYARRSATFWQTVLGTRGERAERRAVAERARALLETVGVTAAADTFAETLSYGEQRRLEIARALAGEPTILLLDEPTAGMNDVESSELGDLFRKLRDSGITVVLIEHNMRLLQRYCEQAAVINFGTLLAQGTPDHCLGRPEVQEAYFGKRIDAVRVEALRELRRGASG